MNYLQRNESQLSGDLSGCAGAKQRSSCRGLDGGAVSAHPQHLSQLPVDPSPSETTCDLSVPRLVHAKPLKDRVKE